MQFYFQPDNRIQQFTTTTAIKIRKKKKQFDLLIWSRKRHHTHNISLKSTMRLKIRNFSHSKI